MSDPIEAPPAGQDTNVNPDAASIFGDISNPAVEELVGNPGDTGSVIEPVQPEVVPSVVQVPSAETVVAQQPAAAPVQPAVQQPAQQPANVVQMPQPSQPVQPTPEQLAQFQAWQAQQAAQQQQFQQPVQQPAPVQHQPQAPRQMSQEDINKALNVYTVTPEEFNGLFTEQDSAKAAGILNGMLQKAVVQAVTMSKHLIEDQANQLSSRVQPYMQFADAQREVMLREQFFIANPDLKGQDLLIGNVMNQLAIERQQGAYRPQSEAQVFSDVATRTKALIASLQQQGQFVPAPQQQAAVAPVVPQGKPQMAVMPTRGGGGGQPPSAAQNAAAAGESQDARNIFG